jgi:hypothetical protein
MSVRPVATHTRAPFGIGIVIVVRARRSPLPALRLTLSNQQLTPIEAENAV